jgi:hypothetical protein
MNPSRARLLALALVLASLALPRSAAAFCGFYVAGADAKLFNNATLVVMMRGGTRTVLSMQNNYQGPPSDFAMVVPVPVVLQKENVKTLPRAVFDHVDKAASPRLVEYWEQNPCGGRIEYDGRRAPGAPSPAAARFGIAGSDDLGVKVEAEFTVGEYEVVILAAEDALGLDTWLRRQNYKIPEGAEPLLRPYVAQGMKFFVAKVNASKVHFENGQAMLSPLRFHYDADTFSLPIRLGLMNSAGTQDLIVHVFARNQRYEAANHPNVTIPTNLDVAEAAKGDFPAFYAALFDRTVEKTPGAVVTEYAWDAQTCDPCPGPTITPGELLTLGADVLPVEGLGMERYPGQATAAMTRGLVLTRLHARYTKSSLGDDLVFKAAGPIQGGREVRASSPGGALEHGATPGRINNFQGRYAVRHPWTGPVACDNPRYGNWGGPPNGGRSPTQAAQNLAFARRGEVKLANYIRSDVPELDLRASADGPPRRGAARPGSPASAPSSAEASDDTIAVIGALVVVVGLVGLAFGVGRRKA